jgi:integrase
MRAVKKMVKERKHFMSKKGENIYKRKDGRWEGRYIKYRTENGKIVYGSVYGKKYAEVKEKLIFIKAKHLELNHIELNSYEDSVSKWIRKWLTLKVRYEVKETTYSKYCQIALNYIFPYFETIALSNVTSKDLQSWIKQLQNKQLSPGTIKNIFNIVNKSLKNAKQESYILINPCEQVELPKISKKKVTALSIVQQKKLEVIAFQEKKCSPVILALYSGMRIGEISGLQWNDIDFKENLIRVRRTVSRITDENSSKSKTKIHIGSPKTSYSIRDIPFSHNLRDYLLKKKAEALSEYVIEGDKGLTEPRTITNRFKKNIADADLPGINFHILRHTFATRCIENGVDIASLSKILGHQSIKMTLDTYTDSLLETQRTAMQTIDKLFIFKESPVKDMVKN